MEEKAQIQGAQTTRILNGFLLERCQLFAQEASERGIFTVWPRSRHTSVTSEPSFKPEA